MADNKRYGHFDDQQREYVITDPQTPWPWINYLGNEDFFSLILRLHEIDPDYRIYLRKHPYIPCWDLNIYAV